MIGREKLEPDRRLRSGRRHQRRRPPRSHSRVPARDRNEPDFVQILINNGDGTFRDETSQRIEPLPASQSGLRRISLASYNGGASRALLLTRVGEPPLLRIDRGDGVFVTASG